VARARKGYKGRENLGVANEMRRAILQNSEGREKEGGWKLIGSSTLNGEGGGSGRPTKKPRKKREIGTAGNGERRSPDCSSAGGKDPREWGGKGGEKTWRKC